MLLSVLKNTHGWTVFKFCRSNRASAVHKVQYCQSCKSNRVSAIASKKMQKRDECCWAVGQQQWRRCGGGGGSSSGRVVCLVPLVYTSLSIRAKAIFFGCKKKDRVSQKLQYYLVREAYIWVTGITSAFSFSD